MTLHLGNCLDVMRDIADASVDMVLTDPPYGTTACKWDAVIPFESMWEHLKRITKPNGAIVLTASQPFTSALVMSNVAMFKYCWVWEKSKATGFLNAKKRPLVAHEDVVVFCQSVPAYNPQKTSAAAYDKGLRKAQTENDVYGRFSQVGVKSSGERYPRSVQYFTTAEREGGYHKTQKPVALMEYLIRTYTNAGETVLDFTMGSGTTGVACKNLGREFIGVERDPEYFAVASARITNHQPPSEPMI